MSAPTVAPARENLRHRFDHFELDVAAFELRSGGQPIAMEPQVFEVLALLVQHHDRVVTKDEILDAVWPERYVTEAALNSRVMSARKALGDDGRTQRYIKTVHGRGYRFVGEVGLAAESPDREQTPVTQALTTQTSWHHALPAPSTTFIGRETELSRLAELLVAGGRPLVTVVGPGGIGKTRLAIAAASRLQTPERLVVYVSLEPVTVASQLPGAIAAALGLKPSTTDTAAELLSYLAGTRLLLVLDNFEQIAADAAPLLSRLVAAAPGVQVLVTSRVVLGLVEEWVFRVEGLGLSDESSRAEAHQLFLERATQANAAAPPPSEDDHPAIADIVRLVDGMPLAIELGASLTPYLPYTEIAALLSRDPGCLASEAQNATPRHRDMRALLEESCRHLDSRQQLALQSLSAFDGPFWRICCCRRGRRFPFSTAPTRGSVTCAARRWAVHPPSAHAPVHARTLRRRAPGTAPPPGRALFRLPGGPSRRSQRSRPGGSHA
ncbi:MAG: winged helix-turn-helix domain-containing protein [Dehalococcoidia bacterium]